jgi:tRNA threonylcarbamoyl adenosine modification protein YeaZ
MIVLAVDTSSAVSSVALVEDDGVIAQREMRDGRRHAETLAPLVREVLQAGPPPDVIGCGVGPGPYTGLRAGIATAQALGLARDVPVIGICSLDALAMRIVRERHPDAPFMVGIDARRREVYWGEYDALGARLAGPHIAAANQFTGIVDAEPHAADVARLIILGLARGERPSAIDVPLALHGTEAGETATAMTGRTLLPPLPLYVRHPDVTVPS